MARIIRARGDDEPPARRKRSRGPRILRAEQLRAQEEARQVLARAHAEAEQIRRQAREEGCAESARMLVEMRKELLQQLEESRQKLTRLALKIAEKLLAEELKLDPGRVARIVEQTLRKTSAAKQIVVRVNAADQRAVEAALPRLRTLIETEALVIQPDPAVERGGCIVESDIGQLDGQIKTQLDAVLEALTEPEE
jgi:flagellar biosynthesis/type III secretory pathway protein FliH